MPRYAYSSATTGLANRASELIHLFKIARQTPTGGVQWARQLHENTRAAIAAELGRPVQQLKGLDIGPGQQLGCLRCFAVENDVVGIDTDLMPNGANPLVYVEMLRHNGATRTIKTLARKALGIDAKFRTALAAALGVAKVPNVQVLQMSATAMTFATDTFDFVYSHSVFEHIDDPRAALSEVRRVLRPGGVAYISIHIYSSHSGCHDPKIMADGAPLDPLWPHLRPQHEHLVRPSTYLNRVSMADWRAMFDEVMPGTRFVHDRQDHEIGNRLELLRQAGELAQYTDEELMTVNYIGVWKKPTASA